MKKTIFILIISAGIPLIGNAQEIVIPQNIQQIEQKIEEKKILLKEEIYNKQKEVQSQRASSTDNTVASILNQTTLTEETTYTFDTLGAVLIKFDGIVSRLESKLSKLEEEKIATTTIQLFAEAQKNLEDSYIFILASKIQNEEDIQNLIDPQVINHNIIECKEYLKKTQNSLLLVIDSLKEGEVATSTNIISQ